MGRPRKFTMIPNKLLDFLYSGDHKLNHTQMTIIHLVIRLSYGYQKEWAVLSNEYMFKAIKKDERQLRRELKALIDSGFLQEKKAQKLRNVRINPILLEGESVPNVEGESVPNGGTHSPTIKDNLIKENSIKENLYVFLDEIDEEFIRIYCKEHKVKMGRKHVRVKSDKYASLMENLDELKEWVDKEEWERGVKEHFEELPENNNGSIIAFMHTWTRRFVG